MKFVQSTNFRSRKDGYDLNVDSMDSMVTNPVNQNSKRYTMKQAFDVWYANKESILFDVSVGVHHGENYKLARPHQLYHLDMHQLNPVKAQEDQKDASSADSENHNGSSRETSFLHQDVLPVTQEFLSLSVVKDVDNTSGSQDKPLLKPPNLPHPASAFSTSRVNGIDGLSPLIQPESIQWIYLDASGNEQGPFAGDVMQEWLGDGYLSPDLKIRRQEQLTFVTLRSFCESINNYILPFKTPLPPVLDSSQGSVGNPNQLVGTPGAFGDQVSDSVSAQATGVSMGSSGLFGTSQQTPGAIPQPQLQNLFNSKMYPQILPNNGFGGAGLRTLSSNLMFDYNGSKDYSLMNQLFAGGSQFGLDALNQNIGGGFGQLHMPSLLHQQIHGQQPVLSRSSSGWAVETNIPAQLPQAPVPGAPTPLSISQSGLGGSGMSQPSPMSPWINRVSSSRAASPFIPATSLSNEDTVLSDIHSSMVTGILNDEEPAISYFQPRDVLGESGLNSKMDDATSKSTVNAAPTQAPQQHEPATVPVANPTKAFPKQEPEKPKVNEKVEPAVKAASQVPEKVQKVIKTVEEPTSSPLVATVLAPWAKKNQEPEAPTLSLKEVQRLEAEVSEKEKQTKAEIQREIALANAIAASKEEKYGSAEKIPSFNWAANSQESVTKKTLAEIQKEEEEAARSRALKKASVASGIAKSSLASTLASTVSKDDFGGAWTAVTKKPTVKKAPQQSVTPVVLYSQMSGVINPQTLRSASSQDTVISVNANALKEEFLVWARSAMTNLYPSVSKNDLLEVFTTLPLHGDSQQLISETIYSSSATMDGRRFAQEFLKKRQQVERQIGSNAVGSWSSAIASSADKTPIVDDDGWSTSVKSKKKNRK